MTNAPAIIDNGLGQSGSGIRLGQWYWVSQADYRGKVKRWLACVSEIGSNYVGLRGPQFDNGYNTAKVHIDDFFTELEFEPEANKIIAAKVAERKGNIDKLLGEVRELTKRLGVVEPTMIVGEVEAPAADAGTALAVMSRAVDVKALKAQLIKAQDKTLPDLFKAIKEETGYLNGWLTATALPMQAEVGLLQEHIGGIKDQIFNISLYAGLAEEVVAISQGEPAPATAKLHVMQRRCYMDEECLANYEAGGMEFKDIGAFDEWIARPENRDRILPFPRTIVAMRVRRFDKERDSINIAQAFINIDLRNADKLTFLYIRNGANIWRLSTDQDFGPTLFPAKDANDATPLMVSSPWHSRDKVDFMRVSEYEECCRIYTEDRRLGEEWKKAQADYDEARGWIDNPYRSHHIGGELYINGRSFRPDQWEPFNEKSLLFDAANRQIAQEIKAYNRIVLIIQGLFDRSPVLHPHPPVNLWRPDHMSAYIEMVYDATGTLHHGDKPDFRAYQARLNALITTDCLLTGQDDYWEIVEAERENERDRKRHHRSGYRDPRTRYRPYGNPGPGIVAKPVAWSPRGGGKATFKWDKNSSERHYGKADGSGTVVVPGDKLLNVSAYTPGDFKQFFQDPRTRQEYLQWAPLMLAAEDHLVGRTRRNRRT